MDIIDAIESETEYLQTTEGEVIPCISIENLIGILKKMDIIDQNTIVEIG